MGYVAYIFNMFFYTALTIKIPIPISKDLVINISIFSLLIGSVVLGLIVWFILKLLNYEINWSFSHFGRFQDNNFKFSSDSRKNKTSVKNTDSEYAKTMKKSE